GLSLGLAFAFLAAALIVIAYRLVVTEELEEDYPVPAHPAEQEALGQLVEESGDRMTRKRLLLVGGGAAGAALGAALVTPAPSRATASRPSRPWSRGRRSAAPATTRPSIPRGARRCCSARPAGRSPSCRSSSGRAGSSAPRGTSPARSARRGGACATGGRRDPEHGALPRRAERRRA